MRKIRIIIQIIKRNFFFYKWTALHIAAMCDSSQIGELLISKGCDIHARDMFYYSKK